MSKESVTVAGIDCGTNSIRLKIARVDADGMHEVVPRILRVIRLGQDVDKTHRFADEALERAYVAAREFAGVIAEHPIDGLRFVATSATRDAENREEFEDEIERILGVRPKSFPHRRSRPELPWCHFRGQSRRSAAPYLVVDLGGGSTELVIGGDGVSAPTTQVQGAFSMNIGSVRMTERHLTNDPPTQTQIDEPLWTSMNISMSLPHRGRRQGPYHHWRVRHGDHDDRLGHGIEGIRSHRGRRASAEP